jgi:DNA-binding GntR family transcriptional regulator
MAGRKNSEKKSAVLRDRAYASIKDAIITARLEPNHRLVEESMAADIGVSRTPVREALQKLEQEGLIFRLPNTGFAVKGVSEEEVEDILGLQSVLERYAARLATESVTEKEIQSLNDIIVRQEECLENANTETFIRLDSEFHDTIHRAAKNNRLYELTQNLRDCMDRYRVIVFCSSLARFYLSVKDHKKIVSLMRTKDAKGIEKLISRHISRGKDVIKKNIGSERGERPRHPYPRV